MKNLKVVNYSDDYDTYSKEEFEALEKWIREHILPIKKITYQSDFNKHINNGFRAEILDNLISGDNIATMASLDIGYSYDYMIVRLAMTEIDPSPVKIPGVPSYYYRAMWKDILNPNISEKWRIE